MKIFICFFCFALSSLFVYSTTPPSVRKCTTQRKKKKTHKIPSYVVCCFARLSGKKFAFSYTITSIRLNFSVQELNQ